MNSISYAAHTEKENSFKIFAPEANCVKIQFNDHNNSSRLLKKDKYGYHSTPSNKDEWNTPYCFLVDDKKVCDPASQMILNEQNKESIKIDHSIFDWSKDDFSAPPINEAILYQIHAKGFSEEGTISALHDKLGHICDLGINAIHLLSLTYETPVTHAKFPYAIDSELGSPDDLKKFILACHNRGISILVDADFIYNDISNHCYLDDFCFLNDSIKFGNKLSPNFDGPYSYGTRNFYIDCALYWIENYHIDGLVINNVDKIYDTSHVNFIEELSETIHNHIKRSQKNFILIANGESVNPKLALPTSDGGYGFNAIWSHDFTRAIKSKIDSHSKGFICEFNNNSRFRCALYHGQAFKNEYSPNCKNFIGNKCFLNSNHIYSFQNYNEIQDYNNGVRASAKLGMESCKLVLGITALSPGIPCFFMGEEFYDTTLISNEITHPLINFENKKCSKGQAMFSFYKDLLNLRKNHSAINCANKHCTQIFNIEDEIICIISTALAPYSGSAASFFNFNKVEVDIDLKNHLSTGDWAKDIYSAEVQYGGNSSPLDQIINNNSKISLSPHSFVTYTHLPF